MNSLSLRLCGVCIPFLEDIAPTPPSLSPTLFPFSSPYLFRIDMIGNCGGGGVGGGGGGGGGSNSFFGWKIFSRSLSLSPSSLAGRMVGSSTMADVGGFQ